MNRKPLMNGICSACGLPIRKRALVVWNVGNEITFFKFANIEKAARLYARLQSLGRGRVELSVEPEIEPHDWPLTDRLPMVGMLGATIPNGPLGSHRDHVKEGAHSGNAGRCQKSRNGF